MTLLLALACATPTHLGMTEAKSTSSTPRVHHAEVTLNSTSSKANATLTVTFLRGAGPTKVYSVEGDDGATWELNDDGVDGDVRAGDGVWAGTVTFDVEGWLGRMERLADSRDDGTTSWFAGRHKIAETRVRYEQVSAAELARLPRDEVWSVREIEADALTVRLPSRPRSTKELVGIPLPLFPLGGVPAVEVPAELVPVAGEFAVGSGVRAITDPTHTLMITDPAVVEDPTYTWDPCDGTGASGGAWTFRRAMEGLANEAGTGITPEAMAEELMRAWSDGATVNGDLVLPAELQITSGGTPAGTALWDHPAVVDWRNSGWDLDLAPFRLYAIVYRPDLAQLAGGGYGSSVAAGGEGRFLFQFVETNTVACTPREAVAIFEYGLPHDSCVEVRDYALEWQALDGLGLGSATYNDTLADLTEVFAAPAASPGRPNGSAINQVRTNDFFFTSPDVNATVGKTWTMREFTLQSWAPVGGVPGNYLRPDTVKGTPKFGFFQDGPGGWLGGGPLAGGDIAGSIVYDQFDYWGSPTFVVGQGISAAQRMDQSLQTCNGCHAADTFPTNTPGWITPTQFAFYHVRPPLGTQPTTLSPFLTGDYPVGTELPETCAAEPDVCLPATFADLDNRVQVLDDLGAMTCLTAVSANFVLAEH